MNAVLPEEMRRALEAKWPWRSVEQGAATSVLVAGSPAAGSRGARLRKKG